MNYLLERFDKIYNVLYDIPEIDDAICIDDEREKEFFRKNRDLVQDMCQARGDFFSSDREIKALILAIEGCRI